MSSIPRHPVVSRDSLRRTRSHAGSVLDNADKTFTRSGRSALVLALQSAGIGAGSWVLVPNYYCPTMIAPVEHVGASPVFYPITSARLPDIERLAAWQGSGGRPTALLAVRYFGLSTSLSTTRDFCTARGITMIEDCAHAFFGDEADEPVGSVGDYVIASLPKFLPVLEGGVLASRRRGVAARVPSTRLASELKGAWNLLESAAQAAPNSIANKLVRAVSASRGGTRGGSGDGGDTARWAADDVRRDALLDPLLAPQKIRSVERWLVEHDNHRRNIERRRRNYRLLADKLGAITECQLVCDEPAPGSVPYVVPIVIPNLDRIYPELRKAALPVYRWDRYWPEGTHDIVGPTHPWGESLLQVNCHQDLDVSHIDSMAATIAEAVRRG